MRRDSLEESLDSPRWWVLKSLPRCEKKIQTLLDARNVEVFLPCRDSLREYPSKRVTFTVPLFPGYVFAEFTPRSKNEILAKTPTAGLIQVTHQPSFIAQIDALKDLLSRTKEIRLCPFIEKGKRVRITTGKFKGMEGVVERTTRKKRLILSIDLLRQSVEVELPNEAVALAV